MMFIQIIAGSLCLIVWAVFIVINWRAVARRILLRTHDSIVPFIGLLAGVLGAILIGQYVKYIGLTLLALDGLAYACTFVLLLVDATSGRRKSDRTRSEVPNDQSDESG